MTMSKQTRKHLIASCRNGANHKVSRFGGYDYIEWTTNTGKHVQVSSDGLTSTGSLVTLRGDNNSVISYHRCERSMTTFSILKEMVTAKLLQ